MPASDSPRWARVGGLRRTLYENSLLLVMGAIFMGILVRSVRSPGWRRVQRRAARTPAEAALAGQYLGDRVFWERTLQNWQSEFLAVGSMVILAVYLSQRGSPESKPVGVPHGATGVEG